MDGNNFVNNGSANGNEPWKGRCNSEFGAGHHFHRNLVFEMGALIGLITGVIGLICASNAKNAGFVGGMRTAGFVCSLIGVIGSALVFVACVACVGVLGTAGALMD